MARRPVLASALALVFAAGLFSGCANRGGDSAAAPAAKEAAKPAIPIPAGHAFGKVSNGMTETDVRKLLGEPTSSKDYMTAKAWMPWYYGSDTSRQEWTYRGKGLITFSRNRYSGGLKVIKVTYDPSV
jgi:outer membrane protein assembly factor BamE (lipoprotein component of BamABCDE complex)